MPFPQLKTTDIGISNGIIKSIGKIEQTSDEKILDFATEKSSIKIGKYMPGNKIPVVHDNFLDNDFPDYALLLAWNFADEIMNNLKNFKKNGGKFIIPIPHPKIV